jgi:hypothetical protein
VVGRDAKKVGIRGIGTDPGEEDTSASANSVAWNT